MQVIITALSTAAVLSPMAIGIALVFRIGGVINFAAGALCVAGGMIYASLGGGWVGAAVALVAGVVLGLLTFVIAVLPGKSRGLPAVAMTLATLGIALIVQATGDRVFGTAPRTAPPWISGTISILGAELSYQRLLTIVVAAVATMVVILMLDHTLIGRGMEACSANEPLTQLYGTRTQLYHLLAWGVAGLCAALTGVLQAGIASIADTVSMPFLVTALVGAVLGGIGSLRATALGIVLVSVVTAVVQQVFNVQMPLAPVFVLLLIGLAVRPAGLFTLEKTGERV
ncbi:branched-chain amino acid ABC transporter permease [Microbacterium sp. No. 7]|uniref:branched-chain amino acid ABC transporter permease n=1 Tax=Microbacterium sp. No. 7 TaxID=1714373 RepID=UPI0006ECE475|nr:branched-chain amino acid ABC transporter permease [Microbacterium sp. No. 7]ALJ21865.1 hypothetical protein AOA12_18970 [Microbacterium sp. No. 7]